MTVKAVKEVCQMCSKPILAGDLVVVLGQSKQEARALCNKAACALSYIKGDFQDVKYLEIIPVEDWLAECRS